MEGVSWHAHATPSRIRSTPCSGPSAGSTGEYTYDDVEIGTCRRVPRSYFWKLRYGRNTHPSLDVIQALAGFFKVQPEHFFDRQGPDGRQDKDLAEITALWQDAAVRAVAQRARGLSPTPLEAVANLIDNLHTIERRRGAHRNGSGPAERG